MLRSDEGTATQPYGCSCDKDEDAVEDHDGPRRHGVETERDDLFEHGLDYGRDLNRATKVLFAEKVRDEPFEEHHYIQRAAGSQSGIGPWLEQAGEAGFTPCQLEAEIWTSKPWAESLGVSVSTCPNPLQ